MSAKGPRTGRPAPAAVVAGLFAAAFAAWLAAAVALAVAAPELAAGDLDSPPVLLAVHLVAVGFLPLAVTGGAVHVLPTLLRNDASPARARAALPLLAAGPALAVGVAHELEWLIWAAAPLEALGLAVVAWELVAYVVRAPGDRMLLASRSGVLLSTLHAVAALVFGGALAARESDSLWGIPHERAIAVHLHLAALGWLTLLLVTVGRTLGPMLALAPAAPRRRLPLEELSLTLGVWLLLAGLALGRRPLELAGAALALLGVGRLALLMARTARTHRLDLPEGPLVHFASGLLFLAQAAALGIAMLLGLAATPRRLAAYVVALLVGWAAGATLGHAGKLLSLSLWTWWPPGPRPKQAALYPARLWLAEAGLFAAGVETVVAAALAGSRGGVAAGGAVLAASAVLACLGAALTLRSARPALAAGRALGAAPPPL